MGEAGATGTFRYTTHCLDISPIRVILYYTDNMMQTRMYCMCRLTEAKRFKSRLYLPCCRQPQPHDDRRTVTDLFTSCHVITAISSFERVLNRSAACFFLTEYRSAEQGSELQDASQALRPAVGWLKRALTV